MGQENNRPAKGGTFTVSEKGTIYYFNIVPMAFLRPSWALMMRQTPEGELVAALDVYYGREMLDDSSS